MPPLFSFSRLSALTQSGLWHREVGPNSEYPVIFLDIHDQITDGRPSWTNTLPCPVIGIGDGPMARHCDLTLADLSQSDLFEENISRWPFAAMSLVQLLRMSETLSIRNALLAESFVYASLQQGAEFHAWKRAAKQNLTRKKPVMSNQGPAIEIKYSDQILALTLNRAETLNEIDVEMRDSLCEAFDLAALDPEIEQIQLKAKGRCFSVGGAVQEFGTVSDPSSAHWIRCQTLPALPLLPTAGKLHTHINGAAIGSGLELAAFSGKVTASPRAWFQLPELKYGLIPGAGGSLSLARRIGRQRLAYMALSMKKIRAEQALKWGLIDQLVE